MKYCLNENSRNISLDDKINALISRPCNFSLYRLLTDIY